MLDEQYEFVLSTHVDKACIHNHIIINSVNFHNGKAFSTEHDRKFSPAWKELKKYSDEITAERGLSVIENSKGKGVSHYEWELKQTGQSWKQKLKIIIDETVKASKSFDDFLDKMRAEGIEVKYEDYVKKSGKCLGFKMPGQKYFIYSQKFGWYYEEAQLRKRIDVILPENPNTRQSRLPILIIVSKNFLIFMKISLILSECRDGAKFRI